MATGEKLQQLQRELFGVINDPTTPTILREDASVLLDTVARFAPPLATLDDQHPVDAADVAAAERAVDAAPASAVQPGPRRRGTWMASEEVPPATATAQAPGNSRGRTAGGESPVGSELPATEPAPGPQGAEPANPSPAAKLQVSITPEGPAARTARAMLAALMDQKLSPVGDVALDLVLAVQRRDIEVEQFRAAFYAGADLLRAAINPQTPEGDAVVVWFNRLAQWR